jgi:outer membrane receptor protein involved in Fe transport
VRKTVIATSIAAIAATSQITLAQQLEEVIVTAEKRATSIQDTPIAVSAFSQDDLDAQLINDQMNLQFNVPSLVMTLPRPTYVSAVLVQAQSALLVTQAWVST